MRRALEGHGYLADDGLATAIFLAMALHRPLFLEGEPGGGKTEVANALSRWTGGELVRLQCYEGIDVSQAVYEWDFARQLLHLRAAELRRPGGGGSTDVRDRRGRVVLRTLLGPSSAPARHLPDSPDSLAPPVLIIDEVDRADDEFEAFLLEVLADYSVTVPELGTFRAEVPPLVVLTSNRTRDVHDALKRRCLYHWVEHPDFEREVAIVRLKAPEAGERLARQVTAAVQAIRGMGLYKAPGVAETIDWAQALAALGTQAVGRDGGRAHPREHPQISRGHRAGLGWRPRRAGRRGQAAWLSGQASTVGHFGGIRPTPSQRRRGRSRGQRRAVRPRRRGGGDRPSRSGLLGREDRPDPPAEDIATYDRIFDSFWSGRHGVVGFAPFVTCMSGSRRRIRTGSIHRRLTATVPARLALISYSDVDQLRRKDFAACTPEELDEISASCARHGCTRRSVPGRMRRSRRDHGRHDSRATMRRTLRSGGEVLRLMHREPTHAPASGGALVRRERLHGAVRPGPPALPPRRRGRSGPGRSVRRRDPAHPSHSPAVVAGPRGRLAAGHRAGAGLVGWNPAGGGNRHLQRSLRDTRGWPGAPSW